MMFSEPASSIQTLYPLPAALSCPSGADVATLRTPDGFALRAAFWPTRRDSATGTVFVLQGRAEFIEKYADVYDELLQRGFALATLDWRGQGGSDRLLPNPRKGHIEDFADYVTDLDTLITAAKARRMPEPWHLLAHSMGGAIALMALARGPQPFRRAILSAPLVKIAGLKSQTGVRLLAQTLSSLGFAGSFVPFGGDRSILEKPFEGNPLTRDETRFCRAKERLAAAPSLAIGDATIGWVDAAMHALEGFNAEDFGAANRTPLLMLLAGADTIVETAAAEALALRYRGASALVVPGARHELLFETDETRADLWAAFDAFVPQIAVGESKTSLAANDNQGDATAERGSPALATAEPA